MPVLSLSPLPPSKTGLVAVFIFASFVPDFRVSHRFADLTDVDIVMESLDSTLFPGIDTSVQVHSGFANEHAKIAPSFLSSHSLGGALAELDCVFMALNLLPNIAVKGVTYGTPRRMNNEKDVIPIVPGRFLGFSHVIGEVHINPTTLSVVQNYSDFSGDDDTIDAECAIMTVPNVFDGDILNHLGPYQGIYIGTITAHK
ncbi:hypothetical protein JVU11DRAFT_3479 [Chiua virens]|nr:hypothetical protein JVU11DRAFT_3479 [Chiua virens]